MSRAREALGMLLIPDDNGKIIKSIEYFNTVSPPLALQYHRETDCQMEIYPGSKLRHFREIHRRTGIPYDQMVSSLDLYLHYQFPPFRPSYMISIPSYCPSIVLINQDPHPMTRGTDIQLFFDDEHRNFEVESLGVTMCLVEARGTDLRLFNHGLDLWRKRRGLKVEKE
jgi:magnesium-dependent phosphatase 1